MESTKSAMEPPPTTSSRNNSPCPMLERLPQGAHTFLKPKKCINDGADVPHFLVSKAYRDIGIFILQLNRSVCPHKQAGTSGAVQTFTLDGKRVDPDSICKIQQLLERISGIVDDSPPEPGPRRFGNIAFRTWYQKLESSVADLLQEFLAEGILQFGSGDERNQDDGTVLDELRAYLLGAFGSAQRLDYGTGHELSFLAFLGCLWKLGAFADGSDQEATSRSIVLGLIEP
jgi:serine/threonine-protein phosphatase 2A activator